MRVCTVCLHTDERKMEHCPSCGGGSIARMTKHGALVSIPADAGMPCQRCFETGKDLRFRQYRRVVAFIFGASIATQAGYFCSSCRGKEFARWQGTTLITGWWGVFAALFYNPFAILMNLWALLAAPFDAGAKGAVDIDEIRAEAAEGQRLEDLYARMPTWLENLSEHELELVFADYDYYATLDTSVGVSTEGLKSAYRTMVRLYHPDTTTQPDAHDRMVAITQAYEVLSDPRLRFAYDHRDELLDLTDEGDPQPPSAALDEWACRACGEVFTDYSEALEHPDAAHPQLTFVDARDALTRV